MSQYDEKTTYDRPVIDVPLPDEEFTLEEILAEYGNSRMQKILQQAEPVPEEAPASAEHPVQPPEIPVQQEPEPEVIPKAPQPISLEEVVGSTVEAVMEEAAEPILMPRRGLFSRRKLEETEELYESPKPEPEPEIEPIGPEKEFSEAADDFRKSYQSRKRGLFLALLIALAPMAPLAAEWMGFTVPLWTGDYEFQSKVLLACLVLTALLCRHVFARAIAMLCRKRCVSELLVVLSALVSAGDCAVCLLLESRGAMAPYGAAACLGLVFAQWGISRESRGMYDTFRAAGMDREPPYLITDTERGACKQRGAIPGFYTAAVKDSAIVLWQTALLPIILTASLVFAGITSLGRGQGEYFLLNWSAILAAGATFSLPLCWSLPFSKLARHLQKTGCAVAGWVGAERISRRRRMILTDTDLFPPGTIQLNGIKIYEETRSKVMAYAATMTRCAGCGLERLFDGLLRGEMGRYETVNDFSFYEEGGYSGVIRGESVLLGTVSFMRKMDVRIPGDIKLKTGIFLAVDRRLIAVFAVKYYPAENVDFALRMIRRAHVTPILAARDPNITPALLKRKFHRGVKVAYPNLTKRVAFSEVERDRDLPRALLFREGLLPYAETVVGSSRACRAARQATLLSLFGSIAGTLLTAYLFAQSAYDLLTPLMLELFLLLWTVPVFLLADRSRRV